MIKEIINNPYRILGVFFNSPKKEIVANKGKLQAFLRVKKIMPLDLDLKGLLPEVQRTQEAVDSADSELALSNSQIKHAQFWFIKKTPIDNIAFNHLFQGDIDSAMEFWNKDTSMYSLQNLFVSSLIKGDYKSAIIQYAIPLYDHFSKEFVSIIDANNQSSKKDLIQNIVETLTNENVNLVPILSSITDKTWNELILSYKVEPLLTKLNSYISEAKDAKEQGSEARLVAGNKLKISSKPILDNLRSILSFNNNHYQIIADKVAQEVLQCSIDYYNGTKDLHAPAKAFPLCEYALSIAIGNAAKQRCEENFNIMKEAYENMPPEEIMDEAREITNLLNWFKLQKHSSNVGLTLLKKAQKPLIFIKEKIGKNHSYYLETSSLLGNAALSYVIDEVNDAQKEDKPDPIGGLFGSYSTSRLLEQLDYYGAQERRRKRAFKLKSALHDAWQTIVYIDLLDKTTSFSNRFQTNRKTLHSIIDGLKGFAWPDENYIIKGCAYNVTADNKFFWSDSEHYEGCSSKSDYKNYLSKFPYGNHVQEAKVRIAEIEAHEKKVLKYVIISVIIAVILFVIILSANAVSRNSSSYEQPSSNIYENVITYGETEEDEGYEDSEIYEQDEYEDSYEEDEDSYDESDSEEYSEYELN